MQPHKAGSVADFLVLLATTADATVRLSQLGTHTLVAALTPAKGGDTTTGARGRSWPRSRSLRPEPLGLIDGVFSPSDVPPQK